MHVVNHFYRLSQAKLPYAPSPIFLYIYQRYSTFTMIFSLSLSFFFTSFSFLFSLSLLLAILLALSHAFDNLVAGAAVDTAIARYSPVPFRFPLRSLANVYTEARTRTRCTAQRFAHPLVPRLLLLFRLLFLISFIFPVSPLFPSSRIVNANSYATPVTVF